MKTTRLFLLLLLTICSCSLFADDDIDEIDINALREFINTKRQETLNEIYGKLSISGEVRTELQFTGETKDGVKQRGHRGEANSAARGYDVEVNLMIDYRTDRTWAGIKIEFDENAGQIGGDSGKINLERAFWGMRLLLGDTYFLDLEAGRRPLGQIFDSRIEFASRFDGLLIKFNKALPTYADFYINSGAFLINEKKDHWGLVSETGLLNILNSGAYTKYSIIIWDIKDLGTAEENNRFRFINSQFIAAYRYTPQPFDKVVVFYAAFLINHAAKPIKEVFPIVPYNTLRSNPRENLAGYFGFSIGQLRKKGDWAIDANYQVVQAQAIPEFDAAGIGLGNAGRKGFYTVKTDGSDGRICSVCNAVGNGNYRGFAVQGDYLITDNLLLSQIWQQSITLDDEIGPFRRYKQFEIELRYAF